MIVSTCEAGVSAHRIVISIVIVRTSSLDSERHVCVSFNIRKSTEHSLLINYTQ